MPLFRSPASLTRGLYVSSNNDAIVTGASARSSMLPVDVRSGVASLFIPANALQIGSHLMLIGTGTIGARLTAPPGFNLIPWFTPAGGSKTDLPGFSQAPLLGTDGYCEIWMKITQTSAGLRTSGVTRYWATTSGGAQAYSIGINTGGTGAAGVLPTVVTSDPAVDRTIGVDGFWGTGADAREYVKCRSITVDLILPTV